MRGEHRGIHMQVGVSFTETLSQKYGDQETNQTKLHRAASQLGSGSWTWLFFPDRKAHRQRQASPSLKKKVSIAASHHRQSASRPRKQVSYGFDQLTTKAKKRGAWLVIVLRASEVGSHGSQFYPFCCAAKHLPHETACSRLRGCI